MKRLLTLLFLATLLDASANAQQPNPLFPAEPKQIAPDVWWGET
jgi:hypothetical protein